MACPASAAYRTSATVWDAEPTGPAESAYGRPRGPARTARPSDAVCGFPLPLLRLWSRPVGPVLVPGPSVLSELRPFDDAQGRPEQG